MVSGSFSSSYVRHPWRQSLEGGTELLGPHPGCRRSSWGQDDVGCDCRTAKETIANTRFVRKMHSLAWEVLSRWPERHSPSDSSWKSPFNSSDPSGLSRAAWRDVQVLVSFGAIKCWQCQIYDYEKKVCMEEKRAERFKNLTLRSCDWCSWPDLHCTKRRFGASWACKGPCSLDATILGNVRKEADTQG